MSIVKMNKFNLFSFNKDRQSLLSVLQNFNYVHFNDLEINDEENYLKEVVNTDTLTLLDSRINKVNYAIDTINKFLSKDEIKDMVFQKTMSINQVYDQAENFHFDKAYDCLKDLANKRDKCLQKKDNLKASIEELSPFSDLKISIDALYDSHRFFVDTGFIADQFFEDINKRLIEENFESAIIHKLSKKDKLNYLLVMSSLDEKDSFVEFLRDNGFSKVKIKSDKPVREKISDYNEQIKELDKNVKDLEEKIRENKKYLEDFYLYEAYLENLKIKEESSEYFLKSKKLDIIEGYIPESMENKFREDLDKALKGSYAIDIKPADKDDPNVPIILKNNKLIEPYESVIETYSLPKYNEFDPTGFIAPFYTIFTGFMLGDFAYGLILFLITLFIEKKMKPAKSTLKTVRMFRRVGLSAMVFGLIFGSIFGGIIPFKGLIDTTSEFNKLLVLSIAIGVVSLFSALGAKAYMAFRDKRPLDALFDVGFWYMAVGGAGLYFMSDSLPFANAKKITMVVMIVGMVGIVLTGGRSNESTVGKVAGGLYELYGISSWIGDFVSFLRLMALVLSGGFVALSINIIVDMVWPAGIGGKIAAIIIFVIFQLFNMFLSTLSAYVHSLRLVYVEMFNKFYEGGGKSFRQMIKDSKFINIVRGGKI